ncbi:MAG: radical SAM protein [Candidatus Aminicenantaceae bacterium]
MIPWVDIKYRYKQYEYMCRSVYKDFRQLIKINKNEYKKFEDSIFINRIYFEVTNICNAKCVFCAYPSVQHKKGVMKFKTFKKAVDEYRRAGGNIISFTPTVGDPLLDPGLLEKIHYVTSLEGIKRVYFYTNGILLGKNKMYEKLIDSGVDVIHLSIPETNKEMYEKICGVEIYDTLIQNVHKLLSYNESQDNKVKIKFDFRPGSYPSEVLKSPDFIEYIQPFLGDRVWYEFMVDYDNWGGVVKKEDLVGVMRLRRNQKVKILPCIRTFDVAILFDGSVRLCACRIKSTEFDDLVIGNIHNDSLVNIFHSEKTKEIRHKFVKKELPEVCKDCGVFLPIKRKFLTKRLQF